LTYVRIGIQWWYKRNTQDTLTISNMQKENVIEVKFNLYNGSKSDIATFVLDVPLDKGFGFGDCFGGNGTEVWLDESQDLDEWEDNGEKVSIKHKRLYAMLREILESNF